MFTMIGSFKKRVGIRQGAIQVFIKIQRTDPVLVLLVKTDQSMKVIDFDGLEIAVKPQPFSR